MINLDKFKTGDFILWANEGGFVGNTIEKHQLKAGYSEEDARFVHIDVSCGGPFSVRSNPPAIKMVDIREVYKGREFVVMRYLESEANPRKWARVAMWALSKSNLPYPLWDILRMKLKFLPNNPFLFFCSELACWSLQKEFLYALNQIHPANCLPAEFRNVNFMTEVYRGRIDK